MLRCRLLHLRGVRRHRPATEAVGAGIPDGWTALVDDTQTLSLSVPAADGTIVAPLQLDNGSTQPVIAASADPDRFFGGDLSVSGVRYGALPRQDVTPALVDPSMWPECTLGAVQPYDDGVFVGYIGPYEGCGGTTAPHGRRVRQPGRRRRLHRLRVGPAHRRSRRRGDAGRIALVVQLGERTGGAKRPPAVATGPQSIDEARQMVADQFGLSVTDEQGQCIVDNSVGIDPTFADGAELLLVVLNVTASTRSQAAERP